MTKKALYLAGGGARGAYQAGVLKALNQILDVKTLPFDMITGVSVGSMNAVLLAQNADNFPYAVEKIETLWRDLHCHAIFNASNYELGKSVLKNFGHIFVSQKDSGFLLDTSPLHEFIGEHVDFEKIRQNIHEGYLNTLEIISNCYETHQTVSFYQHHQDEFDDWYYPRHVSQRTQITKEHILASGALPLFFPAVKIEGLHYGDGSMGLSSPLRGTLRFNMQKVMIVGTKTLPEKITPEHFKHDEIGFAHVLGNMLNGLFATNLDRDIEMVNRMNEIAGMISLWKKRKSPWRAMDTLYLRPTKDVAFIAQNQFQNMPTLLRFLLNVLGAKSHSGDLLSFLLFEGAFAEILIDLGYEDTLLQADGIRQFFKN